MVATVSGKLSEIILAHFEPGEDLYQGLIRVIKEKDIKSGVILSITGSLEKATLHRNRTEATADLRGEWVEVTGPVEVSGNGLIGQVEAPGFGDTGFDLGGIFVHEEPYLHVHITVSSAKETVCGHLHEGSPVKSFDPVSHFTVVLGRIEGAMVKLQGEPGDEPGSFRMGHHLVQF
jgi:predicted DNA-binding protein with PD1-like motif